MTMKHHNGNPILVTGAHRSGTTFLGRMLALSPQIGEVYEPFNIKVGVHGFKYFNTYIKENHRDEAYYEKIISDVLNGKAKYRRIPLTNKREPTTLPQKIVRLVFKSGANLSYLRARYSPWVDRYLIKDPIACMSSEWLHRKFGMDVVVLIRHPAAFTASLKRLGWRFDFKHFFEQQELMDDHLAPYFKGIDTERLSIIEEGSLLWNCIYSVLFKYIERNPAFIAVRHEDISYDASAELKRLYERLNISYTPRIEKRIRQYTGENNPTDPKNNRTHVLKRNSRDNTTRWKKILTSEEISQIKRLTGDLASRYYGEHEW